MEFMEAEDEPGRGTYEVQMDNGYAVAVELTNP